MFLSLLSDVLCDRIRWKDRILVIVAMQRGYFSSVYFSIVLDGIVSALGKVITHSGWTVNLS